MSAHGDPISHVDAALRPDGTTYATHYDFDGSSGPRTPGRVVVLWNVASGTITHVIEAPNEISVSVVRWSPDSKLLASGSSHGGPMGLWDASTGELVGSFESGSSRFYWSPDGQRMLLISARPKPVILSVATRAAIGELDTQAEQQEFLGWSTDGARITLFEDETRIVTYDVETGKPIDPAEVAQIPGPRRYLVAVSDIWYFNPTVKVWDVAAGRFANDLIQGTVLISDLAWTVNAGMDVQTSDYLWKAVPGERDLLISYSPERGWFFGEQRGCIPSLITPEDRDLADVACPSDRVVSPDGSLLAITFNAVDDHYFRWERSGSISIHDAKTGARLKVLRGHAGFVTHLAFSPDGRYLASGSDDGTVILWDMAR